MCDRSCIVCEYLSHSENSSLKNKTCQRKQKSEGKKKLRPARTSTPVPKEKVFSVSNDLVTDFFYESWKSGLHSNDTINQSLSSQWNYQPQSTLQPVCYTPQCVYINTIMVQAYVPTFYVQQVGYRPDGTFGVLPTYWPFNGY